MVRAAVAASGSAAELPTTYLFDFDSTGEFAGGWAWDKDHGDAIVCVDIFDGDTLLATVAADQFEQKLRDGGIGNGRHSFVYPIPDRLKDGKAHLIAAKISGTDIHLTNSPQKVILKPR